jgi:hypothetical protein
MTRTFAAKLDFDEDEDGKQTEISEDAYPIDE